MESPACAESGEVVYFLYRGSIGSALAIACATLYAYRLCHLQLSRLTRSYRAISMSSLIPMG